jgi:hypothetical protein
MAYPWCVMLAPVFKGLSRGAVLADARWRRKSVLRLGFLDGTPELQDRVAAVAEEWLERTGAQLRFDRMKDVSRAAIRISFKGAGSWSLLGRYSLENRNLKAPTMNFGWLTPESSDGEVREVVLHEFGHALGFVHEHQNPQGGLRWKRDVVIRELSGPPNSWSVKQIETNVLDVYDPRELIGTPFDPDSIMLYPFPAEWNEQGIATRNNSKLSAQDIALARQIYG